LIGRDEIVRSLTGSWRLFLGKPDALRVFDTSIEGFWRSFQTIVLVVPIYLVAALGDRAASFGDVIADGTVSATAFWGTEALTLALDWVALPALLAVVAGFIGIKREYAAYVVVRNWAAPLMAAPFAAASLLGGLGISEDFLLIPSLAALVFSLRFGYLIARRTLNAGVDVAIGMVVLDVLVSVLVVKLVGRLTGVELFL
jgi:hypothetical protein